MNTNADASETTNVEILTRAAIRLKEAERSVGIAAIRLNSLVLGVPLRYGVEATGRRADALRALEQSVVLAAPGGYVRRFVDDGRSIAHLLPLVRAVAPGFVDRLIA